MAKAKDKKVAPEKVIDKPAPKLITGYHLNIKGTLILPNGKLLTPKHRKLDEASAKALAGIRTYGDSNRLRDLVDEGVLIEVKGEIKDEKTNATK